MGISRFVEPEFRALAREWIDEELDGISDHRDGNNSALRRCSTTSEKFVVDGCLSEQAIDILSEMAHENFLACRLGLQDAMYVLKGARAIEKTRLDDVHLDEAALRSLLTRMLDDETNAFYGAYRKLRLFELANHFSELTCSGPQDEHSFGRGADNGCNFGNGYNLTTGRTPNIGTNLRTKKRHNLSKPCPF